MRLVHRDISPSNVFIARRGDVKLGDFGIAHAQERESKTQAGTLKGKYGYMSPEQVMGGHSRWPQRSVRGRHRAGRDVHGPPPVLGRQRSRRPADGPRRPARAPGQICPRPARRAGSHRSQGAEPEGGRTLPERGRVPRRAGRSAFPCAHARLAVRRRSNRRRLPRSQSRSYCPRIRSMQALGDAVCGSAGVVLAAGDADHAVAPAAFGTDRRHPVLGSTRSATPSWSPGWAAPFQRPPSFASRQRRRSARPLPTTPTPLPEVEVEAEAKRTKSRSTSSWTSPAPARRAQARHDGA